MKWSTILTTTLPNLPEGNRQFMELKMDIWKFFSVLHKYHRVCNPMSTAKLDELIGLLELDPGATVLDIACGKGEILTRLAERYEIAGVGVDISPIFRGGHRTKVKGTGAWCQDRNSQHGRSGLQT
jgi:ubiquinone/menaquinone biosynthesis C-methylase UbiE